MPKKYFWKANITGTIVLEKKSPHGFKFYTKLSFFLRHCFSKYRLDMRIAAEKRSLE